MDRTVRLLECHRKADEAVRNRVERGGLANIGWTDEAREASLAVRRGLAAAKSVAQGTSAPRAKPAAPKKPGIGMAGFRKYGIRAPDKPVGDPNTAFEGKKYVFGGVAWVVKNGVLQRDGPAGMPTGQRWNFGSGSGATGMGYGPDGAKMVASNGQVISRMFDTVLKKMREAGVKVGAATGEAEDWYGDRRY